MMRYLRERSKSKRYRNEKTALGKLWLPLLDYTGTRIFRALQGRLSGGHDVGEGIDFGAYCNSIGVEAYVAMDLKDLNELAYTLWVRKAVANTRALMLTARGSGNHQASLMDDARKYMYNLAHFGHHQVLVFGNYLDMLKSVAQVMYFNILEGK